MSVFQKMAKKHSLNSFINSFVRDFGHEAFVGVGEDRIDIKLDRDLTAQVPLSRKSGLGFHETQGCILLFRNGEVREVDLSGFSNLLLENLFPDADKNSFSRAVAQGEETLSLLLDFRREDIASWTPAAFDYVDSEQALLLGHPFHPYPKARRGFSKSDESLYSPERKARFNLVWLAVDEELLELKNSNVCREDWLRDIADYDFPGSFRALKNEGYALIPFHPWQWKKLKEKPAIHALEKGGRLRYLGKGRNLWNPTSSLRSVVAEGAPWLLKFSLSVWITNSLRHLKLKEAMRGPVIDDILSMPAFERFWNSNPNFHLLREPGFAAIKDPATGVPLEESFILCRESLPQTEKQGRRHLLATLVQAHPFEDKGDSLAAALIRQRCQKENLPYEAGARDWIQALCDCCVIPLMELACEHGVLLGAHLQNVIIDLDDKGLPRHAYFRDC